MSTAPENPLHGQATASDSDPAGSVHSSEALNGNGPAWHRVGLVSRRQGVSTRTVARHWNVDVTEVRRQQHESTDLSLSQLYRWQQLLNVPITELLIDEDQPLSAPILRRAQLVKVMKTAATLQETAREVRVQRMVATLISQLIEIMPELANVGPWHGSGDRRTLDDYGRAVDYRLSDDAVGW